MIRFKRCRSAERENRARDEIISDSEECSRSSHFRRNWSSSVVQPRQRWRNCSHRLREFYSILQRNERQAEIFPWAQNRLLTFFLFSFLGVMDDVLDLCSLLRREALHQCLVIASCICLQFYATRAERWENDGVSGLTLKTFAKDLKFIDIFVRFQNSWIGFEVGFVDVKIAAIIVIVVVVIVKSIAGHLLIRHFAFEFLQKIIVVFDVLIFSVFDF